MSQELAKVHFVDQRFAKTISGPDAGTIEIIYELDSEPDSMMSMKLPSGEVPEGLRSGAKIIIEDEDDKKKIVLP